MACALLYPALLLSKMPVRFIHDVVCIRDLFLCIAEWYSIVWLCHNAFIHFLVHGYVGFQTLAIINIVAVSTLVHIFL